MANHTHDYFADHGILVFAAASYMPNWKNSKGSGCSPNRITSLVTPFCRCLTLGFRNNEHFIGSGCSSPKNTMDLLLSGKTFIVTGAGNGFGNAIARVLAKENAEVIAISRTGEKLSVLQEEFPKRITTLAGDVTQPNFSKKILPFIEDRNLGGIVLNAAGPPLKRAIDCQPKDFDQAYSLLFRWKTEWINELMPVFIRQQYGRIVSIESISIKYPLPFLALSTSLRLAVTGYFKSLANETAPLGITVNIIAPGYHDTPALNRITENLASSENISAEEAKNQLKKSVPVNKLGNPNELASLAAFLLSPLAGFITGQTISIDGGSNPFIFG